tara:strand:+ start:1834 stop:2595 length:762 start_codon:yes stop_codon:yes gene_type:complete
MTLVVSKNDHPAESTHWYTKLGTPAYQVMGKNGKMRNTTLRDAREKSLVPSVTTILKSAASPGLERWKLDQMLHSALTLPKIDGESESEYLDRIRVDSREQGRKAAERGTAVHAAIEGFYMGNGFGGYENHIRAFESAITKQFGECNWLVEKAFAADLGFGGKIDLCSGKAILDAKSKEFGPDTTPNGFDEHLMQLAAYRMGMDLPTARCANVFVSVTHPGLVHIHEWTEEELQKGWKMFVGLLGYWYAKTGL